MPENNTTPTPEELQEEQETLAEVKDDELRSSVATSLGLEDNDQNKELINKLVAREKESRIKLSKAIKQKIDWRTKAQGAKPPKPQTPQTPQPPTQPLTAEEIRKQADASAQRVADEEFLEDSDFSDVIKELIRQEAARTGVSARKAAKTEFIQFKLNQEKQAKAADEAADNGSPKGKKGKPVDPSKPLNPADYDLSTPEGRKEWDEAKKAHKQGRQK